LVAAVYILVKPSLDAGQWPTKAQWFGAIFAAVAGMVIKDGDKTGTGQPGDAIRGSKY
jgi:hypothetical protein